MGIEAASQNCIVIIGGTTGMGLSAALALVKSGAFVVAVGRNPESVDAAQLSLGQGGRAMVGDACDASVSEKAIRLALDHGKRLSGLYHVAGGSGRRFGDGPLHEMTDEGLDATMRHNLYSLMYSNRAAVRQFLVQGSGGSILNMGSVLGYWPSPMHFSTHAYSAAKAAVLGHTRACAAYYAPHNIRFNAITPALVETPMSDRAMGNEQIQGFIKTKQPLDGGRAGKPEDLDAAVLFFLTEASRFVTGQVLCVDGGWSVCEGQYVDE